MPEHKDIPTGQIHVIHQWEFASAFQRDSFKTTDVKNIDRLALQRDDGSFWRLAGIQPTVWAAVGQGDPRLTGPNGATFIGYQPEPGMQTDAAKQLDITLSLDVLGLQTNGADESNRLQRALDLAAQRGVTLTWAANSKFTHSQTLYLNRGQKILGGGPDSGLVYTGTGVAVTTKTPGVRNYNWNLANFTLSTTTAAAAGTGMLLDSMSTCVFDNVRVVGFKVNWDIYAPTSGYAVYNRLYNCYAQGGKGFRIRGTSANANLLYGCRGNLCLDGSYEISDSNDNTDICCQWESGGNAAPAISITARQAGISPNNRSVMARFEGNTGTAVYVGPNVSEYMLDSPMFTGALPAVALDDQGVRTRVRGVSGISLGNKESSALPVTRGPAFRKTRTVGAGTDGVPMMLFEDTNAGSGNPVTVQADTARATGVVFRASLNGVPGADITGNGDVIAKTLQSSSIIAGGGTPVTRILSAVQTYQFPAVAAGGSAFFDMPVAGVVTGGIPDVSIGNNNYNADLLYTGTVVAANTVRIRVRNLSAAAITPLNQTFRATVRYFT